MFSKSEQNTIRPLKSWQKSSPMHTATPFSTQKIAMRAITRSGGREDHLSLPVQKNSKDKLSFITQMSLPASKNRRRIKLHRKLKMLAKLRSLAKLNTIIFPTSLKSYSNWRKLRTLERNLISKQRRQQEKWLLKKNKKDLQNWLGLKQFGSKIWLSNREKMMLRLSRNKRKLRMKLL